MHKHTERVFSIPQFLSEAECLSLIALAESDGFSIATVRTSSGPQLLPAIRNNQRAMLHAPTWRDLLWQRLQAAELPLLDGEHACGLPKDLRFYKYSPGQKFKMHKDGPWREDGLQSKLSFLVYLNQEFSGGATDFREFKIQPSTGDALLFIHDTWHEGQAVEQGCKYVLRSDVMYSNAD